MNIEHIKKVDPQVAEQIELELKRQQETIELIASENITSLAVMEAAGSVLTNKYAEGKPHKRFYNGCEHVDVIEELAQNVRVNFSIWIMLTFSRTLARRQIWQFLFMHSKLVIPF